jgi:hypothetical protein
MACGFQDGPRQAAQSELPELAGAEPRYVAEFIVSDCGNAVDDLGVAHLGLPHGSVRPDSARDPLLRRSSWAPRLTAAAQFSPGVPIR